MYSLRSIARSLPTHAAVFTALLGFSTVAYADAGLEALLSANPPTKVAIADGNGDKLRSIYQTRHFRPLWPAGPRRDRLIAVLGAAGQEGLDAPSYLTAAIKERQAAGEAKANELDMLLTDAAMRYASDLRSGQVDPDQADHLWQHNRPSFDAASFITQMLETDDGLAPLADLAPPYLGYRRLRDTLAALRQTQQAGGWPTVTAVGKDSIKPGMQDERIAMVRKRLAVTGEYTGTDLGSTALDGELSEAIKRFQSRHGLDADGVLGRGTAAAMAVTVDERIEQIIANMERWRWLPRALEPTHLFVNIGGQYLNLVKDGEVVLQTRVVVGKPTHRTVAFRAAVTSVTLNPPWNVPDSIASKEILPELKKNPDYLVENRLRIVGAFPPDSPESDGIGINWHGYSRFPYQLRQVPGRDNSLGVVKFNMPNANDIYLHDTPSKALFQRARRAFSHGCVRVQDPMRLAATLIGKDDFAPDKIKERIQNGVTQTVQLTKPVPIYLFYFTAWVDADGKLELRDDIYGYDRGISSQLAKKRQKMALMAKS